jgi:hypothetical protein
LAAVPAEFLLLAVGALLLRADPDVNGSVHKSVGFWREGPRPRTHQNSVETSGF